jgi:hypothetical protein
VPHLHSPLLQTPTRLTSYMLSLVSPHHPLRRRLEVGPPDPGGGAVLELPEQASTRATVASVQRGAGGGASASSWSRRRPDARRWSRLQARVAGSAPECPLPCSGMPFFLSCCLTPSIPPLDLVLFLLRAI